jgi:2-methylcitrate dehydratase PrpD
VQETVAVALAGRALAASAAPERDQLRVHLALNALAAMGEEDLSAAIAGVVEDDRSRGAQAFRLAAAMHARTQDDNFAAGRIHIGTAVVPAVLVCDAADPVAAMAAGYEVAQLVSTTYTLQAQALGLRPTPIFGAIGAAAAAAVALDASVAQVASAISFAAASVSGTNQAWIDGADEWLYQVASGARIGVEAALLAMAGVAASAHALEGDAGFCRMLGDQGAELLRTRLGEPLTSPTEVENKPLPVGGVALSATLLAVEMGRLAGGRAPDVLVVRLPRAKANYPGAMNRGPFKGRSDSLMSVARCVALGYLCGNVPYAKTASALEADEQYVLDRTVVTADDDLADGAARLELTIAGESRFLEGECREFLYPTWDAVVHDTDAAAARYEAPPAAARTLVDRIVSGAWGSEVLAAIRTAKPDRADVMKEKR